MITSAPVTDVIPSKTEIDKNRYTYVSAYYMGKIGIKKIIEDPSKSPINTDNRVIIHSFPINNITNNTNNNTNNTNTNTNSNTNNNSSKNRDNQTSKKKLKNHYSVSPNIIHIQPSSNYKYYKNKSNQRLNKIKKTNLKPTLTQIKFGNKHISKSSSNFHVYTNAHKNSNYLKAKSYSKKKIKSKSSNKLIKERKDIKFKVGMIKSHSGNSSCIFTSMSPINKKRQKKKYSMSNTMINDINNTNNTNTNSFKRSVNDTTFIKNGNLSSNNLNPNIMKLISNEDMNNYKEKKNFIENNIEKSDNVVNYLRVRKRSDLQNNLNHKNNMPKIESTPLLNNKTEIKLSSPPSSFIFNEKSEKRPYLFEKQKNKLCIDENISSEDCANIIDSNFIPKLNLESCKRINNTNSNANALLQEKIKNKDAKGKNTYDNDNGGDGGNSEHLIISNLNISNNGSKINIKNESEIDSKNKEKETDVNVDKKLEKNKVLKTSNNISNYKSNVKQNRVLNKSNTNNYRIISFKNNYSNNNITSYKNISTEENVRSSKKNRNNSKILSSKSKSKNKYQNIKRINYSLSNNKSKVKKKENKYKVIQFKSNRNKTTQNSNCKCKNNNLHKKVKEVYRIKNENLKEKEKEKKEELDFDCPEEMHYFMVNLTINYRILNENF